MKRQIVLTSFLIVAIGVFNVNAKQGISFQINYSPNHHTPDKYANKDIREFHAFQKDIRDFSNAVYRGKKVKSRRIKKDILRRMHNEIEDTRAKIYYIEYDLGYSELRPGLHNKKRSGRNEYSKRSTNQHNDIYKHLKALNKQLKKQKHIVYKLERMDLNDRYNFHRQAREHEVLMYKFEEILKSDINHSFKEYRNRNRIGH